MKTEISDIFFDLDDTLWDFQQNSYLTFADILKKRSIEVSVDRFFKTYRPINNRYWSLFRAAKISKDNLRFMRLADTFKTLDMKVSDRLIHTLAEDYMTHLADHNSLLPNTKETLDYLAKSYNLHIITNGFDEVQIKKLRNARLDTYFKTVTTSDQAGVKKPDPLIFELALKKGKTYKEHSLMIGDNFEADVIGADKAGWEVVHFNPTKHSDQRYTQISTIDELKTWL